MALELVTGPTQEPVTLDELRDHCRIDHSEEDGLIAGYLIAARQWVEGQTKRIMMPQTFDYFLDYRWPLRFGGYHIRLPVSPVKLVSSVNYVDESGTTRTLAANQYIAVYRETHSSIVPAYNVSWPTVQHVPNAVTIRFNAGYSGVPYDLRQAILFLAAHFYEQREAARPGIQMLQVPYAVEALISPHRTVVF